MTGSSIPYAWRGALLLGLALVTATPARGHVQLDLPNGGEVLAVDSVYTVTWHILIAHSQLNWDVQPAAVLLTNYDLRSRPRPLAN